MSRKKKATKKVVKKTNKKVKKAENSPAKSAMDLINRFSSAKNIVVMVQEENDSPGFHSFKHGNKGTIFSMLGFEMKEILLEQ